MSERNQLPRNPILLTLLVVLGSFGCGGGGPSPTPPLRPTTYTEKVLYSFAGKGAGPGGASGLISDSKGNLYGTSGVGGDLTDCVVGCGLVFKLSPPATGASSWTETVLYSFTNGIDGGFPSGGLILDGKENLYGTAGLVFELSPSASGAASWTEKVLFDPTSVATGALFSGGLTFDSQGNLYGTTEDGGLPCLFGSCGLVLELSPPPSGAGPWTETVLYNFTGLSDGSTPSGGLIFDAKANLYGITYNGGITQACAVYKSQSGCGVVFRLSPPASGATSWTETVLYSFTGGTDGAKPSGGLISDSQGNLYGTSGQGGDVAGSCASVGGCGVVFKLSPPAGGAGPWTETVLYSFTGGTDGASPSPGLIFDSQGNIYGSSVMGGHVAGSCASVGGCGVVFKLSPPAGGAGPWTETVLYSFTGGTDGASPSPGLIFDSQGNIYGTTQYGGTSPGAAGNGVVFELSPS